MNSMNSMPTEKYNWVKAYTLKTIREARIAFFWTFKPGEYEIQLEFNRLMTFEGDKGQAERLVAMLNGAYNLGRSSAIIEAEVEALFNKKEPSNDSND